MNMAKALMIQGTMSNAGKSLLVAGLCRILKQDGYRVAPFKSQNMALNSYITRDGYEMGRAQVVQAEAAGILPDVRMNPILLKPTSDMGSQVIVNGEAVGNMPAREYFKRKTDFIPDIQRAYDSLAAENDVILIEGAGSPAEINLKRVDIVNMGMARMAKAPVLLVGDIDRGGVFAQLAGTMLLLEPWEQQMVKGLIVNKFRGDVSILEPGLRMIEEITRKPVVGTIPYLRVDIEDEDSLSERLGSVGRPGAVDLAVIRLPRISNFTDFDVFQMMPEVSLRYVSELRQLGNPDLILLPGTKSTLSDLRWLRQSGLEGAILKAAGRGIPVFGICGGYQMMGESISDPTGVEGGGTLRGMGLLPVHTVFAPEKTRTQAKGRFGKLEGTFASLSGMAVEGYEIHMGTTEVPPSENAAVVLSQRLECQAELPDGCARENLYGSYLHGIFDGEGIAAAIVRALMERKGLPLTGSAVDWKAYKEKQYDLLAEGVRAGMDMKRVYQILDDGVSSI